MDDYPIQREVQILVVTNSYRNENKLHLYWPLGQTQILPYFALLWVLILSVEYAITRMQIEIAENKVIQQERKEMYVVTEHLEKADKERERQHKCW